MSTDNEEEGEKIGAASPILKKRELRSLKSAGKSLDNLSETKRMKSASNLNAGPLKKLPTYLEGDENFCARLTSEPDLLTSDFVYPDETDFTQRTQYGMLYYATRFLRNILKICVCGCQNFV